MSQDDQIIERCSQCGGVIRYGKQTSQTKYQLLEEMKRTLDNLRRTVERFDQHIVKEDKP